MDPNLYHLQPGLPEDPGQVDDGASYLRRLKAQPPAAIAVDSEVAGAPQVSAAKAPPGMKERRRSPRFACSGCVELFAEGSNIPMRGTLSDISLHGCYTEMSTTLPVNTNVTLLVDSLGFRFRTQAMVRASYPFLGMGMCFSEIEPQQQSQLAEILAALAGQRDTTKGTLPEAPMGAPLNEAPMGVPLNMESLDLRGCVEDIVAFFQRKTALSREEFYEIAKRVRRS